jgi:hypothetical protein
MYSTDEDAINPSFAKIIAPDAGPSFPCAFDDTYHALGLDEQCMPGLTLPTFDAAQWLSDEFSATPSLSTVAQMASAYADVPISLSAHSARGSEHHQQLDASSVFPPQATIPLNSNLQMHPPSTAENVFSTGLVDVPSYADLQHYRESQHFN